MKYSEIQKLRQQLLDEILVSSLTITIDHLMLVEMRLNNIILAGIKFSDVEADRKSSKGDVVKS